MFFSVQPIGLLIASTTRRHQKFVEHIFVLLAVTRKNCVCWFHQSAACNINEQILAMYIHHSRIKYLIFEKPTWPSTVSQPWIVQLQNTQVTVMVFLQSRTAKNHSSKTNHLGLWSLFTAVNVLHKYMINQPHVPFYAYLARVIDIRIKKNTSETDCQKSYAGCNTMDYILWLLRKKQMQIQKNTQLQRLNTYLADNWPGFTIGNLHCSGHNQGLKLGLCLRFHTSYFLAALWIRWITCVQ